MNIVFVAAEIAPFAKAGGLADVAGALPMHLHAAGHDVRVFMPLYSLVREQHWPFEAVAEVQQVPLQLGEHHYRFSLYATTQPGTRLSLYFIDCPALFDRPGIYTGNMDEHRRFLMLQHATLQSLQRLQFAPDILHCNDWHTALLPLLLKTSFAWDRLFSGTRTLLSIHNIGYQGVFGIHTIGDTGIGDMHAHMQRDDLSRGQINWLKEGIVHAHAVSTVSPTYAKEICLPQGGHGLDGLLRQRLDGVTGILNGVDYTHWNPATDALLPAHYSPTKRQGKTRCKQVLTEQAALQVSPDMPIIGIVSRLVEQKGIDILMGSLPELLSTRNLGLVVLGSGESHYVDFFNTLMQRFPERVCFCHGYDERLAHLIEAGADMFLMPSRYEPCGLNQMYSLKYGTVPIVRKTGGLADSVQMWDGASGTGIVFNDYDAPAVTWAVNTALDLFKDKTAWERMMRNGMSQDFSWGAQIQAYVQLYANILRSRA